VLNLTEQAEVLSIKERNEKNALKRLRENRNSAFAVNFISTMQDSIDNVAKQIQKQGIRFDCKAGCTYCCTLRVEALAPEVFRIARELKKLKLDQLAAVIERLKVHAIKAAGVPSKEFYLTCPLLVSGLCSIYGVRPGMCRKFYSLDVEQCKNPDAEIPENLGMVVKSGAIMCGVTRAYERAKFSAAPHELGQALLLALTDSTAEERWGNGELVFDLLPEALPPHTT